MAPTPTTHTLSLVAVNNDLPAPQSTPIYVGIGLGTQNYSCSGAGATAVSIGAYAHLYSATSASSLTNITTAYVERYQSDYGITGCLLGVPICANLINLSEQRFPTLGEHYFTETTPTFNLGGSASSQHPNVLFATVKDKVDAPSYAYAGSNDEGAVKWLYLEEDDTGRSTSDASYVYRVDTAGGTAPTCTEEGNVEIPYSAQYWFYA
ncbi:malate dehydrogenase like protein [Teratosphaeria destructans]|uniref:Malate dehydrogenase like protein n=1 Tax=Teratosphaeria destructans TaxID=418781 RepID=A0A9W7W1W6_9PEZI|nr:malate dehydrogenase like protein [Teratosphaeria destructans]